MEVKEVENINVPDGKNGRRTHNVVYHGCFEMILKVSEGNSVKSTPASQTKCCKVRFGKWIALCSSFLEGKPVKGTP